MRLGNVRKCEVIDILDGDILKVKPLYPNPIFKWHTLSVCPDYIKTFKIGDIVAVKGFNYVEFYGVELWEGE